MTSLRPGGGSLPTCRGRRSSATRRSIEVLGATVSVKHENHQPIGVFKVQSGVDLVAQLSDDERDPRPDLGVDRQPRPVDRLRRTALRRAGGDLRARGRQTR